MKNPIINNFLLKTFSITRLSVWKKIVTLQINCKSSVFTMFLKSVNLISLRSLSAISDEMLARMRVCLFVAIGIIRTSDENDVSPFFCERVRV